MSISRSLGTLRFVFAAVALAMAPMPATVSAASATAPFTGKVVQTMDVGSYTYAEIDTGDAKIWAAAPRTALKVGDEVVAPDGILMRNFTSKTLDRTFEEIYFVSSLRPPGEAPAAADTAEKAAPVAPHAGDPAPLAAHRNGAAAAVPQPQALVAAIAKQADERTVAELHENAKELAGTAVAVRGKVTKFTGGVLGKNWIHIDDGSGGDKDLTVTTDAVAKIGDTVSAKGVLGIDRDFGAGYRYDVIIEDATVTVE